MSEKKAALTWAIISTHTDNQSKSVNPWTFPQVTVSLGDLLTVYTISESSDTHIYCFMTWKFTMAFVCFLKKKEKNKNDFFLFWSLQGRQHLHTLTCTSIIHSMTAVYCYVCTRCPKPQTANLSLQGCHLKVNWGAIKTTGTTDVRYSWGETGSVCVLRSKE